MVKKQGKDALLAWCARATESYDGVKVENFTKSWKDGLAFVALLHAFRPDVISWDKAQKMSPLARLKMTFEAAEKQCRIPRLLDAEDIVEMDVPDKLSMITYLSEFYHALGNKSSGGPRGRFGNSSLSVAAAATSAAQSATASGASSGTAFSAAIPAGYTSVTSSSSSSKTTTTTTTTTTAATKSTTTKAAASAAAAAAAAAPPKSALANPPCAKCGKPLVGKCATFDGAQMHAECLGCWTCGRKLATRCIQIDSKPYCEGCGRKAFIKSRVQARQARLGGGGGSGGGGGGSGGGGATTAAASGGASTPAKRAATIAAKQLTKTAASSVECAKCRRTNNATSRFCVSCGESLIEGLIDAVNAPPPPAAAAKRSRSSSRTAHTPLVAAESAQKVPSVVARRQSLAPPPSAVPARTGGGVDADTAVAKKAPPSPVKPTRAAMLRANKQGKPATTAAAAAAAAAATTTTTTTQTTTMTTTAAAAAKPNSLTWREKQAAAEAARREREERERAAKADKLRALTANATAARASSGGSSDTSASAVAAAAAATSAASVEKRTASPSTAHKPSPKLAREEARARAATADIERRKQSEMAKLQTLRRKREESAAAAHAVAEAKRAQEEDAAQNRAERATNERRLAELQRVRDERERRERDERAKEAAVAKSKRVPLPPRPPADTVDSVREISGGGDDDDKDADNGGDGADAAAAAAAASQPRVPPKKPRKPKRSGSRLLANKKLAAAMERELQHDAETTAAATATTAPQTSTTTATSNASESVYASVTVLDAKRRSTGFGQYQSFDPSTLDLGGSDGDDFGDDGDASPPSYRALSPPPQYDFDDDDEAAASATVDEAELDNLRVPVTNVSADELRAQLELEVSAMDVADAAAYEELQGYLYKRNERALVKTWKKRYFHLKAARLIIYDNAQSHEQGIVNDIVELENCVCYPFAVENRAGVFQLICPERTIVLQAPDDDVAHTWMVQLRLAAKAAARSMRYRADENTVVAVTKRHEPKSGWLEVMIGVNRAWKRRWIMCRGGVIYVYVNASSTKPKAVLPLYGVDIALYDPEQPPPNLSRDVVGTLKRLVMYEEIVDFEHAFQVVGKVRSLVLKAADELQMHGWLNKIVEFKASLEETIENIEIEW